MAEPEVRELLAHIWTNPMELDPSRRSAKVTRKIADKLALLALSFEHGTKDATSHWESKAVSGFLMRCLFCMFAEDVGLMLPASQNRRETAKRATSAARPA